MKQAERWRTIRGHELLWFRGDDGQVVYHGGSGDTHFLDDAAAGLLDLLSFRPHTTQDLADHLRGDDPRLTPDEASERAARLVRELAHLDLIEPC